MDNKLRLSLWGRVFDLSVEYECYDGDVITEDQIKAVKNLSEHPEWIEKAKKMVEDYCREDVVSDQENKDKENIFSYIRPIDILVKSGKYVRAGIICDYRYNEEDGIAIAFYLDGRIKVGEQGIMA